MSKPIYIYILTNECFNKENLVKIGYTDDIEERLRSLSNTSVYKDFEVYATYEVDGDIKKPDALIHSIIDSLSPSLRLNPRREFYEMYPWDAYGLLERIAILTGTTDKLVRYKTNDSGSKLENEQETEYTIDSLFGKTGDIRNLFNQIEAIAKEVIGTNARAKALKHYVSIKKDNKHNVVSCWPKDGWIEVVLNAKLGNIKDDTGTIYDISNRCWTAAQYAFRFDSTSDVSIAKKLITDTFKAN